MLMAELPEPLQQQFEQTAQKLYDHDATKRAMIDAVELWLAKQRKHQIDIEADANDKAYVKLKEELERNYWGKWVVIAYGQLQGAGDSLAEINHLAPDAQHRIVMQVGERRPKEVTLGWQIGFD
ncbi:MAG: hypothetical protein DRR08_25130 [Candidatus Parabeggiatoa sp. nov. 2]|nr:MAG: hypothetical protein B6247_05370 [Beggiatoa sp. 4572_84]RKZ55143.1 MAG: hypothetical protein DRR08_25130 [Gammaproteobacteria bacterium]